METSRYYNALKKGFKTISPAINKKTSKLLFPSKHCIGRTKPIMTKKSLQFFHHTKCDITEYIQIYIISNINGYLCNTN